MDTQISRAIEASNEFVKNLHRDGLDRGCIATFNNYMTVRQNFTENKESLCRSLNGLIDAADGGTRLYDSIVEVIQDFHNNGDASRPWILVVVTDGDDIDSRRSLHKCAQEISNLFTENSNNFLFLIGVGDEVDSAKMEEMATIGNFSYFPVKSFFLLELIFIYIANKITTSLSVSLGNVTVGNQSASWAEVQRHRRLSKVAIDYALLIDISGSMNSIVTDSNNVIDFGSETRQPPQRSQRFDSRIINSTDAALLASWIDRKQGSPYNFDALPFNFRLIYRASRDGFEIDRFHNNCDDRGPTVVVIKVKYSGEIIGGYNPLEWRSVRINEGSALLSNNQDFYIDQKLDTSESFIFSLTDRKLSRVTSRSEAIIWSRNKGPCFGLRDLYISNNFGTSVKRSYETRIINKKKFEIEEYEVFQIIDRKGPEVSIWCLIFLWILINIQWAFMGIFKGIYWTINIIYLLIKWTGTKLLYAALIALCVSILVLPIVLYLKDELGWAILSSVFIYIPVLATIGKS